MSRLTSLAIAAAASEVRRSQRVTVAVSSRAGGHGVVWVGNGVDRVPPVHGAAAWCRLVLGWVWRPWTVGTDTEQQDARWRRSTRILSVLASDLFSR